MAVEQFFKQAVQYGILFLEAVGAILILVYAVESIWMLITGKRRESRKKMTTGITSGLTFLLGSEVLKTIAAPDWKDVGMTCAVLLMRAAVTLLLYWENKHEINE